MNFMSISDSEITFQIQNLIIGRDRFHVEEQIIYLELISTYLKNILLSY